MGKAALVTGAASGIGAATVAALRAGGVTDFALVDRAPLDGDALLASHDVADEAAWLRTETAIAARFGGIDYAVVNAGVSGAAAIADLGFDEWRRILSANLDGAFLTLRTAMRLIRPGGAIVCVASASGIKAEPGVGAYAASKAGLIQLARVAAREGAGRGIRVNAIAPGGVETPIWNGVPGFAEAVAAHGERAAFDAMARIATPLGRFATPQEIAAQIAFLLSDAAATITGAVLTSDGGYTL
jgi:NAD(P)-dependent dehydrogenase (short-subunit alcohol dehydrogenase family)